MKLKTILAATAATILSTAAFAAFTDAAWPIYCKRC